MKSIIQIKTNIDSLSKEASDLKGSSDKKEKAQYKAKVKRILFLRQCVLYLESDPRIEYLKREASKIETIISAKTQEAEAVASQIKGAGRRFVSDYLKQRGIPVLKKKLEVLRFLQK